MFFTNWPKICCVYYNVTEKTDYFISVILYSFPQAIFYVFFTTLDVENFLRTGYYVRSDGYIFGRVTYGYWWSTTAGSATNGRYLGTDPTGVDPQCNYYRGRGFAVRCVVREG